MGEVYSKSHWPTRPGGQSSGRVNGPITSMGQYRLIKKIFSSLREVEKISWIGAVLAVSIHLSAEELILARRYSDDMGKCLERMSAICLFADVSLPVFYISKPVDWRIAGESLIVTLIVNQRSERLVSVTGELTLKALFREQEKEVTDE
jgi:hypothetical protein